MSFTFCWDGHFSNNAPRLGSCGVMVIFVTICCRRGMNSSPTGRRTSGPRRAMPLEPLSPWMMQTPRRPMTGEPLSSDRTAIVTDNVRTCLVLCLPLRSVESLQAAWWPSKMFLCLAGCHSLGMSWSTHCGTLRCRICKTGAQLGCAGNASQSLHGTRELQAHESFKAVHASKCVLRCTAKACAKGADPASYSPVS